MNSYYRLRYFLGFWKKKLIELADGVRWAAAFEPEIRRSKMELRALKDRHQGKRCFVVGNGPSLNRMNLDLLKNEFVFVSNAFFLKFSELGFIPSFYIVEDHLVAEDNQREIENLRGLRKFYPFDLRRTLRLDPEAVYVQFPRAYAGRGDRFPSFGFDAGKKLYWGGTVTYFGIQLAAHMGFSEIILIGVDLTYQIPEDAIQQGSVLISQSDDPNHFNAKYFGKGKRWHLPEVERMQKAFSRAHQALKAAGRQLLNATIGGNLKEIPRVEYESLFR